MRALRSGRSGFTIHTLSGLRCVPSVLGAVGLLSTNSLGWLRCQSLPDWSQRSQVQPHQWWRLASITTGDAKTRRTWCTGQTSVYDITGLHAEGDAVSDGVGDGVGDAVGYAVGDAVGYAVGDAVGDLGSALALSVCMCVSMSLSLSLSPSLCECVCACACECVCVCVCV